MQPGDGAHFDRPDPGGLDPGCFGDGRTPTEQDIGAFRSLELYSLAGKLLRLDPHSGLGMPDNPFYDGDPASLASRIWARGLRNPYRVTKIPGSGWREALFVGDVGWGQVEEIDLCFGGENFGWPCYEGTELSEQYSWVDVEGRCDSGPFVEPWLAWHHWDPGSLGFVGQCVTGVAWYDGTSYPEVYRNTLFFCDYRADWVRFARVDSGFVLTSHHPFGTGFGRPVELLQDPFNEELILASFDDDGNIRRLRYVGGNSPPSLVATANPYFGDAPLEVLFDASGSSDPEGRALEWEWDFDDGTGSDQPVVTKTLSEERPYHVRVRLTDDHRNTVEDTLVLTPGNTPPSIDHLDSPTDGSFFGPGEVVPLIVEASDAEDDASGLPLNVEWHFDLVFPDRTQRDWVVLKGADTTWTTDFPRDDTYFRICLVIRDSWGLEASTTLSIYSRNTLAVPVVDSLSDPQLRLGQTLRVTAHLAYPGNDPDRPLPSLAFDWGDGTEDEYAEIGDGVFIEATHTYLEPNRYLLRVGARHEGDEIWSTAFLEVMPRKSAIAVFYPLVAEETISWIAQERAGRTLVRSLKSRGFEARSFVWSEQSDLEQWMTPYLSDDVRDALVILDTTPSVAYAGELDDSLAERWIESGNGIVWSGALPFSIYIREDGSTSRDGAGFSGADDVLDARAPFIGLGSGPMELTPRARRDVPALSPFIAESAIRLANLGNAWRVARLWAEDAADRESDALLLEHTSRGFYAQVFCLADDTVDRGRVITQILEATLDSTEVAGPKIPR